MLSSRRTIARVLTAILVGTLSRSVGGCQESGPSGGKSPFTTRPCPKDRDCRSASESGDETDGSGGKNGTTNNAGVDEDRGDLPTYLFTVDEAKAIKPLVRPYEKPDFARSDETSDSSYETTRRAIERQLDRIMALTALAPGRDVQVFVNRDSLINAYADGFQRVFVTTGSLQRFNAEQALAVICHELGHVGRNHQIELARFELSADMRARMTKVYDAVDAYLADQYDESTGYYVHDTSAYRVVRDLWDDVEPELAEASKRVEAEADIVGAMYCGAAGMPTSAYAAALGGALATISGDTSSDGIGANSLKDGERFKMANADLFAYLFPKDSHPTDAQRNDQLRRVDSVIAKPFDVSQQIFGDWRAEYTSMSASFGLTEALSDPAPTITSSGRVLKRVQRDCNQRH